METKTNACDFEKKRKIKSGNSLDEQTKGRNIEEDMDRSKDGIGKCKRVIPKGEGSRIYQQASEGMA